MILDIIIIGYIVLMIMSTLARIILIGEHTKPITASNVIFNLIINATFIVALCFKVFN